MGTAANVLVGIANMFTAPVNTSAPTVTPATGIVTPLTPWVAVGFSTDGVAFSVDNKTVDINVEEQTTPIDILIESADVGIEITLSEDTIASMVIAYGGATSTVTAASGSVAGTTLLNLSDSLTPIAVCFIGVNSFGLSRLVYIPSVVSAAKVSTKYRRAKEQRMYPVQLRALCDKTAVQILEVTATET